MSPNPIRFVSHNMAFLEELSLYSIVFAISSAYSYNLKFVDLFPSADCTYTGGLLRYSESQHSEQRSDL